MEEESGFRSERMELVQILIQKDAAHDSVDELARLECVQFKDSDDNKDRTAFQREYAHEVRLCDEILRKVRFIKESAKKLEVEVFPASGIVGLGHRSLNLTELSTELGDAETELRDMFARQKFMDVSAAELLEHQHLLKNIPALLGARSEIRPPSIRREDGEEAASLAEQGVGDQSALRMIAGLIDLDHKEALLRVVYRVSRGNALVKYAQEPKMFTDTSGAEYERDCFVVIFTGNVLQDKIGKLLASFGATRFAVPDSAELMRERLSDVSVKVEDHIQVKREAIKQMRLLVGKYVDSLSDTELLVTREKGVHACMNLFNCRISNRTVLAEAWVPKERLKEVEAALRRGVKRGGGDTPSVLSVIATHETPPTYIKVNKLTSTFQSLNDAYGTPRYMELNPGIFYVVTYSFLFGVMFGDVGHGTLMLLGALFLVINEKKFEGKKLNDLVEPAFQGRYVLLLMSVFSIYCGAVYNECFGIALIPYSYYALDCPEVGANETSVKCGAQPIAPPPFGVDPIWSISENKLGFNNSFKMKISIIIGVAQMCFGLACKTSNCLYFKQWKELYFENIPEFLFLLSLFGYLAFLIILKWTTDWVGLGIPAPPLLDTLLKMLLEVGSPIALEDLLYPGQATLQPCLVALAAVCVPWMLLPKPLLLQAEHKNGYKELTAEDHGQGGGHGGDHEGEFDFQETMIHQSIHTIEFVLGSISNTASYLRLWALSLAHAGLSEVFWERAMLSALEAEGLSAPMHGLAIFCAFSVWASMTFGVLMVMETLSACLHDIRLHWVEFQNKFYKGDGYAFVPLSYASALEEDD